MGEDHHHIRDLELAVVVRVCSLQAGGRGLAQEEERQEEDRPGHQKLCRNGPPRQIDRVDRGGRRSEHRERDPVVLSDEDRRGPHRDPVHHREKRDLHREADRAREDLDGAHRQRTSHRCGAGDP